MWSKQKFLLALGVLLLVRPALAESVRLLDRLAEAEIESPLIGLPAEDWPSALEDETPRTLLFHEDFERFLQKKARWPESAPCRAIVREDGKGRALVYEGGGGHKCFFVLPAEPSTHYLIRRSVRTDDPLVDINALESRIRLRHPDTLNHPEDVSRANKGKFIKASNLLFVHHLPEPHSTDEWENGNLHVFTSPFTRSLVLIIHDAESAVGNTERDAWFDDLTVEKLAPPRKQELALLKNRYRAEESDASRGMLKHGQLLPIGNAEDVQSPYDANHDYRYALFAPAPTRITFPVEIPEESRLRFSCGLLKQSRPGDEVAFRILVEPTDGKPVELFSKTLRAKKSADGWHWYDQVVSLERFSGQKVRLTLQTDAPEGGRGYGVWANPTIDVPRKDGDPPNIILIAIDTLRADRLSCYGRRRKPAPTSPNIDALAEDGVLFLRTMAQSNWTTPSFASMFTGLAPSRHRVVHRVSSIAPAQKTLAEMLREGGWATHGIAYKTYLYNMGFEQGFDSWFNVPRIHIRADDNLKKALAWLEDNHDRRFFLFLHFNDPHQPFNQPQPFDRLYNRPADLARFGLRLPIIIGPHKGIPSCEKCMVGGMPDPGFKKLASDLYDGEVAYLDDRVGRFLRALKDKQLYEDAVILFVSDHGELVYEKGSFFGHGSHHLCDELIRVPMILKPPKDSGLPKGRIIDAQVRVYDLMPTLLELAGLPTEDLDIGGRSLLQLLSGKKEPKDRVAFSENVKHHVLSVRRGEWMYRLDYRPRRPVREKLFHSRKKPTRSENVAESRIQVLRRFRMLAMEFFLKNRSGRHLVVTGDGTMRHYRIRLRSEETLRGLRPVFGLPEKKRRKKKDFLFSGRTDSPVILYTRLPPRAKGTVMLQVASRGAKPILVTKKIDLSRVQDYEDGRLSEVVDNEDIGAYFFKGPPRIPRRKKLKINAQRIEALRSLGYVE
jgi:arylsulfatase A-like enzyme